MKAEPESGNQFHGIGKENVTKNHASTITARNRLFRISIMSCACLLMNTAATLAVSVDLEEWSLSSDLWLKCHTETGYTRNWANYGMHVGDRYSFFL